jgi:hypothetical protein
MIAMTKPTATSKRIRTALSTGLLMLLSACDGPTDVAGIQGSGSPAPAATTTTVGPITGFGSIFVDGVEYSTTGAQISIDGQAASESQLNPGQIVTISGTVASDGQTGTATQVTFNGDVQGSITGVNATANTFVVLGQTVKVTTATVLDSSIQPADITGVLAGVAVEVSGLPDATGAIVASRIDLKTATTFQVKGVMQGLDSTAHTLQINGLTIDYSAAAVTGSLANGSTVLVHGGSLTSGGTLLATGIEVLPGLGTAANQRADVDGIISTFTSSTDFVVDGLHVTTDANTNFVLHGATLAANLEVDVQGQFNSSGTLVAQKVQAKPQSTSLVAGTVGSVTASSNTLTVLGVPVTVGSTVELDDRSNQHVRMFRLSDVNVGDYVTVDGSESPPGTLIVSVLQRLNGNGNTKSIARGVALNVSQPNFTVLGVSVTTTAQTTFIGFGGAATDGTTFFSQGQNHIVLVSGAFANGVLTADKVSLQSP